MNSDRFVHSISHPFCSYIYLGKIRRSSAHKTKRINEEIDLNEAN
jgi:hypothetical protein